MENKVKMLVIDDSKETVAGLYHFFSQKYEVFTALDGLEGLKLFETEENGNHFCYRRYGTGYRTSGGRITSQKGFDQTGLRYVQFYPYFCWYP